MSTGGSIFSNGSNKRSNKPTITVLAGQLPQVVDQGEQALIDSDLGYYQVSGRIVRAGEMLSKTTTGDSGGRLHIVTVCHAELIEALTKAAEWLKPGKTGPVTIDCPATVAETLLARTGLLRLPPLTGIIDVPTLRCDGSLLWRAGYDSFTGLLLMPGDTTVPRLPPAPTRDEAMAALSLLQKLIAGFPFVTDADKSVALSALLTSAIRTALRNAPAHGFTAPTAGSGKSTVVDLASVIRTGREAAPISQGRTNEELEKRLGALLMEGEGLIAIDNCETALGGDVLCQLLTQQNIKVRVLGHSTMIEVPTTALVTATGNNLSFLGDMSRRALLCQLDPGVERPELRQFSFDPVKLAKEQRADFVAAALTILRAYHVAGRPYQVPPLGSFADWSNWVRSALIWLDCADPCDTMEKVRKADPQMALIKQVMAQWKKVVGPNKVTTGDLNAQAEEMVEASPGSSNKKPKYPEFRDALLAVAGEGARINGRRLGRWLSKQEGRVVGGYKFSSPSTRGGQSVWVLETPPASPSVTPKAGD
jgi:putative DNA primase/helicase